MTNWGAAYPTEVGVWGRQVGDKLQYTWSLATSGQSYGFQGVTYRGTLNVDAVFGQLSNVVQASTDPTTGPSRELHDLHDVITFSENLTRSVTAEETPATKVMALLSDSFTFTDSLGYTSGAPAALYPNEPLGYTLLSQRSFNEVQEENWIQYFDYNLSIVSESVTGGGSPGNVGRARFRTGPIAQNKSLMPFTLSKTGWNKPNLYVCCWLKFSSNWQNHQSTTNKIFYITDSSTGGGGSPFYLNAHGAAPSDPDAALDLRGQMQHPNWSNRGLSANLVAAPIVRGTWYKVELLLKMNTGNNSDGEFHMWVDNTKRAEYTNVRWSDGDHKWDNFRWEPIWGGRNDDVQEEMYQYMDHIYLSTSG
jgi:hypothetical protein